MLAIARKQAHKRKNVVNVSQSQDIQGILSHLVQVFGTVHILTARRYTTLSTSNRDIIFRMWLKQKISLNRVSVVCDEYEEQQTLTMEEENALRYSAGFVPHSLLKKLKKSSNPLKEELCLCLREMIDDTQDDFDTSQMWVELVDRGGLKHINQKTFRFFLTLEEKFRRLVARGVEQLTNAKFRTAV